MRIDKAVSEYVLEIKTKGYSKETVKSQGWNLGSFGRFIGEATSVDDITKSDIKRYIVSLQDLGRKAKTINHHIMNLRTLFKFLLEEELVDKDPTTDITLLKAEKDVMRTYSPSDVQDILNSLKGKDYLTIRNKTMIMLLVGTGIRCSELCGITIEDLSDDSIRILGKGNKVRYVPIPLELKRQIQRFMRARERYCKSNEDSLFVNRNRKPLRRERVYHIIEKIGEDLGLDVKACVHQFRRFYAQQMLTNTDLYTVSRLLGHNDIKTTQIYIQGIEDKEIIRRGMNSPLSSLR